jgi:hypothetical protein
MIKKSVFYLLLIIVFTNCSDNNNSGSTTNYNTMYFPPTNGTDTWEIQSISSLGWNQSAVQPLLDYLEFKHSKSFIILVNGRIVMENYFQWTLRYNTLVLGKRRKNVDFNRYRNCRTRRVY